MHDALENFVNALIIENNTTLQLVDPSTKAVFYACPVQSIAFQREVAEICSSSDRNGMIGLINGLPLLGWAPPCPGMMERVKLPLTSMMDWEARRQVNNDKVIRAAKPSGDPILDQVSFEKSIAEVTAGVIIGPFTNIEDTRLHEPNLAIRQGIWEAHGDAEESTVRVIDNLLLSEQKFTSGTVHSHRPTDADGLTSQVRAVSDGFPSAALKGWPSDFSKAYKHVATIQSQLAKTLL